MIALQEVKGRCKKNEQLRITDAILVPELSPPYSPRVAVRFCIRRADVCTLI